MKELITSKIEEVRYNGGHSTRKPSTVTMAVPHKFAVQVADLIEEYEKQGIEPEDGLIRLELVAHYADEETEIIQGRVEESKELEPMTQESFLPEEDFPGEDDEMEQVAEEMTNDLDEALEGTGMEGADSD
jgi:hypothetical protein